MVCSYGRRKNSLVQLTVGFALRPSVPAVPHTAAPDREKYPADRCYLL